MSFDESIAISIFHIVVWRKQIALKHRFWVNVTSLFVVASLVNFRTTIMMLWHLPFFIWKLKLSLKMILISHTFRSRIFIKIHVGTSVFIISIVLCVRRLLFIWTSFIIQLWWWFLVHFSCISSFVTISLIFFLLFILLIEVVHYVIVISVTFFKDTLDHALSIRVLHRLFSVGFTHLVWIIGLVSSAGAAAVSILIAAYLVLLFEGSSVSSARRLSECQWLWSSTLSILWRLLRCIVFLLRANRIFFISILLYFFT